MKFQQVRMSKSTDFSYIVFLHQSIHVCCGYSLVVPCRSASDQYPTTGTYFFVEKYLISTHCRYMFLLRNIWSVPTTGTYVFVEKYQSVPFAGTCFCWEISDQYPLPVHMFLLRNINQYPLPVHMFLLRNINQCPLPDPLPVHVFVEKYLISTHYRYICFCWEISDQYPLPVHMFMLRNKEILCYLELSVDLLLTIALLNSDIPCLRKQFRFKSVGFWRSQLFAIKYVNL